MKVGLTLSLHDIQAVPGGEENAAKEWAEEFTHYLDAIREDDFLGVQKNFYDFSQSFDTEWEQELESFLLRDRNHPSIVLWSIGNELPEQSGIGRGYETSTKLTEAVRRLDPTRPVCGALYSFFHSLDDKDNKKYWQS